MRPQKGLPRGAGHSASRRWHNRRVAVSRADRRRDRTDRVVEVFGEEQAPVALDLLELTELAWHDCYGQVTPPDDVIEDMLLLSGGSVGQLVRAARLGVADWRDLRLAAEDLRSRPGPS